MLFFLIYSCTKKNENRDMLRNDLVYDLCREGVSTSKDSMFYIHYLNDYCKKNDSATFCYFYINIEINPEKPVLDYISLFNDRIDSSFTVQAIINNELTDLLVISPMNEAHEEDDGLRIYSKKGLYQKIGLKESHVHEITKIAKNKPYDEILIISRNFELGKDSYRDTIIYQHNQDSLKFIIKNGTKNHH